MYHLRAAETMPLRGMTFIEAIVGSALMMIVFLAIFAVFQVAIDLVFSTKAATGAGALVNEQMEYIRGLDYSAVGTVGGIPAGGLPQTEGRTLNGITYTLTTLVQYVDDPADGLDADDETGITADYKLVKVRVDWQVRSTPRSTFAITRIAPSGIESLSGGGTLRVNVFDTLAAPVSGAEVHIVNDTLVPAIDITVTTGASGSVVFPGAPPGVGYEITVTKDGYSEAATYAVTAENPNPNPGHVSVVDQTTTTVSLSIDVLGSLSVFTFSPVGPDTFDDTFSSQSLLSATTSVTVAGDSLVLEGEIGSYVSAGAASSIAISPSDLAGWTSIAWTSVTPPDTEVSIDVYYWNGTAYVLVPDTDLSGNGSGFSGGFLDLTTLPVGTYGNIRITANLSSADPNVTPEIQEWSVAYTAGPTPLPDADFDIHGAKTVGISGGGAPLYKYDESHTTTQYGEWIITPIEADAYDITLSAGSPYAIVEQCPSAPSVSPAGTTAVNLTLDDAPPHSLRVIVSGGGSAIADASVFVSGPSYEDTHITSACGQIFSGSIPTDTYTVQVSANGYQTAVENNVSVSGETVLSVTLAP